MTGRDFHNDKSSIALLLWLKSRSAKGAFGHPAVSFHLLVSLICLVDEFFFLLLKYLKEMRTLDESKAVSFSF